MSEDKKELVVKEVVTAEVSRDTINTVVLTLAILLSVVVGFTLGGCPEYNRHKEQMAGYEILKTQSDATINSVFTQQQKQRLKRNLNENK